MYSKRIQAVLSLFSKTQKKKKRISAINRERPPSYSKVVPSFDPPPSYFQIIGARVPTTGEEANSLSISIEKKKRHDVGLTNNNCRAVLRPIPNTPEDNTHMLLSFPRRRAHESVISSPITQATSFGLSRIQEVTDISRRSPLPADFLEQEVDWRASLLWIVQYSLKSTLHATIDHFQSLLSKALLLRYNKSTTSKQSILVSEIEHPKPITLSSHRWLDFVRAIGFSVEGPGTDTDMSRTSLVLTKKLNKPIIQRLQKLLRNMSDLPYDVLHVISQLSADEGKETHEFLYHFYGLQGDDYRVVSTHETIRNVRHKHRRPWLVLQNLGFNEIHSNHKTYITISSDSFKLWNRMRSTLEVLWTLYIERE